MIDHKEDPPLKLVERFLSIQGEGAFVGRRAFFVRFAGCNLSCYFCDSTYAWKGGELAPVESIPVSTVVADVCKEDPDCIVITGGEPLLHSSALCALIDGLRCSWDSVRLHRFPIEIETNGTLRPLTYPFVHYNVSPKLPWSMPDQSHVDYKAEILSSFCRCSSIFKFVVRRDSLLDDVLEVDKFVSTFGIPKRMVYLMAEGVTKEAQLEVLPKLFRAALEIGFRVSPRLHVLAFDNLRGV